MERWMKKEKRNAERGGSSITFFDKGYEKNGRKIMWEDELYDLFQELFADSTYFYCYSSFPTGILINYLDFNIEKDHFRFFFYVSDDRIQWNVVVYDKKNGSYFDNYDHFSNEKLKKIAIKTNKMISLIEKMPRNRVKIAIKELYLEKENKFTHTLKDLETETEVY